MSDPADRYIVTLTLITGGPPETTSWSEYGATGLVKAVEAVDWDVTEDHASKGIIQRVLPSGECIPIYERTRSSAQ